MIAQIRQERLNKSLSQEAVAKQVGTTNQTISMIETGQRKPSFEVLVKLLKLYEVPCYKELEQLFSIFDSTAQL